jgi:hypothetical protein
MKMIDPTAGARKIFVPPNKLMKTGSADFVQKAMLGVMDFKNGPKRAPANPQKNPEITKEIRRYRLTLIPTNWIRSEFSRTALKVNPK